MLEYVVLYIIEKVCILQTDTHINVLSTRKHENILSSNYIVKCSHKRAGQLLDYLTRLKGFTEMNFLTLLDILEKLFFSSKPRGKRPAIPYPSKLKKHCDTHSGENSLFPTPLPSFSAI